VSQNQKMMIIIDKKALVNIAKSRYLPIIEAMLGDYELPLANIHFMAGPASKVIPSTASKYSAGLVIIGSIRRKGLKAKVMGNTAESVLALLKTDILVIQP
jgi:universal stress protein E